jgi:2-methylisocitrate lyase-like PEP mutase family enzyme
METKISSSDFWRLNGDLRAVTDELIDNGGELTEELTTAIERINAKQEVIAEAIFQMANKTDAQVVEIDNEIKRLQGLKKARQRSVESLKRYLLDYMLTNGIESIDSALFRAKVCAGRESVIVNDEEELKPYAPYIETLGLPSWVTVKMSVNKTELGKWIKEGKPTTTASIVKNPYLKIG